MCLIDINSHQTFGSAFSRAWLPPIVMDFIFKTLWAKLTVGANLRIWTRDPWCPMCATVEKVDHALHHCRFHSLARDVIDCYLGPYYHKEHLFFLSPHTYLSQPPRGSHCGPTKWLPMHQNSKVYLLIEICSYPHGHEQLPSF